MSNIKGAFFPYQVIPAKALGSFASKTVRDGVLDGCGVTFTGTALTIGKGFLIACGRVMEVPGDVTLSISGATSGYARVSVLIDTAKASTQEAFEQADFLVEYSATEDGFADPYAENINMDGTYYQLQLCVVILSAAGISAVVDEAETATVGGLKTIWENASPTSSFAAQTLTLQGIEPGALLVIDWLIDPSYVPDPYGTTLFLLPESGTRKSWQSCAKGSGGSILNWDRNVTVSIDDGTLAFSKGLYSNGNSSTEYSNIMIPQRISILR